MGVVGRLKDGELLIPGELNERLPVVTNGLLAHYPFDGTVHSNTKQFTIRCHDYPEVQPVGIIDSNGTVVYGYGRDWHISVWDKRTNDWATGINFYGASSVTGAHARYDVYGSVTAQSAAFVNTLANLSTNYIVIIGASHAPENHTAEMDTEIKRCGGTTWRLNWHDRSSYICVGEVGCGEGKAISEVLNNVSTLSASTTVSLYSSSSTNTSTTLTSDGIAVEEATTNNFNPTSAWTLRAGLESSWRLDTIDKYTVKVTALINNPAVGTYGDIANFASNYTVVANVTVTYSCEVVSRSTNLIYPSTSGWGNIEGYGYHNKRAYRTITHTTGWTHAVTIRVDTPASIKANDYLIVKNFQIEQKAFPTSFVDGSRVAGNLTFPILFSNNMTFHFTHKPYMPTSAQVGQSTSPNIIDFGNYYMNASMTLWCWGGTVSTYIKGNTGSGWQAIPGHKTFSAADWLKEHKWTLVMSGATGWENYKVYLDGVLISNSTLNPAITSINGNFIAMGSYGGACPNAIYKDLSIYNRALTDTEITKLAKSTFSISNNGDMLTDLIEQPIIPASATYFSLGQDVVDQYKVIGPSSQSNIIHEDSAVWVGLSTPNLAGDISTYAVVDGSSSITLSATSATYNGSKCVKITKNTNTPSGYTSIRKSVPVTPSVIYTVSWKTKVLSGDISSVGCHFLGGNRVASHIVPLGNGWYQQDHVATMSADSSVNVGVAFMGTLAGEFLISELQLEQRPFSTPYVVASRGITDLEYNLNSSIGLDWSGNWTIIYWKKPVGTSNNNFTGYSIESLGCNGNSVGGGYIWWGKVDGQNYILGTESITFDPANYFGKWHMVSLKKSGTTLTITHWGVDGKNLIKYQTVNATSNYYVNQYGYDLKLGGWDSGSPCNTFFRDLIVVKSDLSDSEISKIYNTQMRAEDSYIQIQKGLKEGKVL